MGIALAGSLVVVGVVLRHRPWSPWLSLGSLVVILVMGTMSPDTRVDTLVMGTYSIVYLAILITSRPWGLVWMGIGVLAMSLVVSRSDLTVSLGDLRIDVGSVAVVQLVVAGGWLWWAWHSTLDRAARRDMRAAAQERVIADSVALQERTRAWRDAIVRTHETILNDLRYVLRTPRIDRDRLREQLLTTQGRRAQPPTAEGTIATLAGPVELQHRLRAEFHGSLDVHDGAGGRATPLLTELEPILVEIVRNVARHADAQHIDVTFAVEGGALRILVEDDGTSTGPVKWVPGIGRSVLVGEALASLGGRIDEEPHWCAITVPLDGVSYAGPGSALPLLFGIVLIGSSLGGSLQFLLLLSGVSLTYMPVTLAACALTALGVITVLRAHPVGLTILVPGALLAAMVTWGMVSAQPVCAEPSLVLTTLNLSLNAFFAILLWARNRWAWLLVAPALIGVLALDVMPGVVCPIADVDVLLSSAILIPAALVLSWASARSANRWEREDRLRWEIEISEIARAEADRDLARELGDSIDEAWLLMWQVADGAELDDARRRQLRTVESSIRASLQVDPRVSGGFVIAARQIVSGAALLDTPVHVRALRGSVDPRPLPADFIDGLVAMLTADPDAGASIHVFFDGYDDYLTLTLPAAAAARGGFTPGDPVDLGCCAIEVSFADGDGSGESEVTIIVSRTAEMTELVPAVVG
jgi:signal transduction histidine kinase